MLSAVPGTEEDLVTGSDDSSSDRVLTDADVLAQICSSGAVSQSESVAQLSRRLLTKLLAQRGDECLSEPKQLLLQWIPYIEVQCYVLVGTVCWHMHSRAPRLLNWTASNFSWNDESSSQLSLIISLHEHVYTYMYACTCLLIPDILCTMYYMYFTLLCVQCMYTYM